jgi:hypothetical protein
VHQHSNECMFGLKSVGCVKQRVLGELRTRTRSKRERLCFVVGEEMKDR